MNLDNEYVRTSDLFERAVSRISQLASLAAALQDAIASQECDSKALYETAWLLSELLHEQQAVITQLQDYHRRNQLYSQLKHK